MPALMVQEFVEDFFQRLAPPGTRGNGPFEISRF